MSCDDQHPRCGHCVKADQQCIRNPRRSRYTPRPRSFGLQQIWVPVPPKVDFVDETPLLQHGKASDNRSSAVQLESPHQAQLCQPSNDGPLNITSPSLAEQTFSNEHIELSQRHAPRTPQDDSPFPTKESAELMRYFIDNCACFFDFSDADRHFAYHVPLRARRNATLANAMLALAARHRSRTGDFEPFAADRYYNACLQTMIPKLGDSTAIRDDELLAAIVILRLLEEMDVLIVGLDPQKHLFGTQAIIAASQAHSQSPMTALRKACYWAAFRQEIFMSLSTQRPFKLILPEMKPPQSPSDDWSWALRATYQCGKVQAFVFDEEFATVSRYLQLVEEIEQWQRECPMSFDPVYQETSRLGDSFPDIRLQSDCHVMGWQYIIMAHLLLNAHRPLPRVGPSHKQEMMDMEKVVKKDVKTLCGIARSNPQTPPASLVACMVGDRFDSESEQALLRDLLLQTELSTGWPTCMARVRLEQTWNWTRDTPHYPN
ncbi:uncharacterized protein Z519_05093 [Cladophialophora bantiana CBS 173.52]|uniref:Zn(2)-C6 fungal-type domain-containing protein n=1 Tax=Cladophialophora bantiana (strain ATCC 10958 / CBS 173.52 / CDC B-1940 / NIH 8579) TaxID=1442370 RepID=A0A0D2HKG5_CLAB1|nr:uncharacterized protein Z519_05093 [Cladophialophora bantiana CBS 173.52]KIW93778.1 hypothetical protein Z519_05093 [Cladophialophora bantiana CBS 173.52]